jgi:hypothetical protein
VLPFAVQFGYMAPAISKALHVIWEYKLWAFFVSIIGLLLAVPTVIAAWDQLRHRWWDSKVFDLLAEKVPTQEIEGLTFYPLTAKEIAKKISRSEKSVLHSLKRLKKGKFGDQVVEAHHGWFAKDNAPKRAN